MGRPASSLDRPLLVAFGVSLACHTLFLGFQLVQLHLHSDAERARTLDVVYEYQIAEQDVRQLQRQLTELRKNPEAIPAPAGVQAPAPTIRIPDRPTLAVPLTQPDASTARTAVVDLTNLVDAAQGNPVLLSYFSALREQIQRTANQRTWLTGQAAQGIVLISFVLSSNGEVLSASVVADRSVPSRALQDIAMRIVKASSPFVPFPPSLPDSAKTIVVPLEFLVGPSS